MHNDQKLDLTYSELSYSITSDDWEYSTQVFFFMFLCSVFSIIAHSFIIWKKAAQASCKTASYVVLEKQERFGNTWEWVNDERTLFSGWTIPLKALPSLWTSFFFCVSFSGLRGTDEQTTSGYQNLMFTSQRGSLPPLIIPLVIIWGPYTSCFTSVLWNSILTNLKITQLPATQTHHIPN